MQTPRTPSLTPDDLRSHSWSQRPVPPRLQPRIPPSARARAAPPPPPAPPAPAQQSNVIDLTSDSPPPRTRALSQAEDDNLRRAKRQRVPEAPGNAVAGPSRPARRLAGFPLPRPLVIDSDSDDDIIVVEPTPSGSGSWRTGPAAAARQNGLEDDEMVVTGGNPAPSSRTGPRVGTGPRLMTATRRSTGGIAPRRAPRSPPPFVVPPPAPNPSAARTSLASSLRRNFLPSSSRASSTSAASASLDRLRAERSAAEDRARAHRDGAGDWGLQHLMAQHPGMLQGGFGGGAGAALANYYGYGGAGGLQGVMGWGTTKVVKGKKYGVRMSHPRKVEEGFSRDVVNPLEEGESRPKSKGKGKGKKVVEKEEVEPVCAGCLEPLLLAQSGERRPWALRCGHVVCGRCVGDAKMRCEGIKEEDRKARWRMNVDRRDEVVFVDDDEELDYVDEETTLAARLSGGKGKGKSRAGETGVEEAWTMCPVASCDGAGTDLLAAEGDCAGAFELFV